MTRPESPGAFYRERASGFSREVARLRARGRACVVLEVLCLLLAVAFLVASVIGRGGPVAVASFVALSALYLAVRRLDAGNTRRADLMAARHGVCEVELACLEGDFSALDDGSAYVDPDHPYSLDLDVFGRDSLFNRMCRAVTSGGRDRLAGFLGSLLSGAGAIERRREAIAELSGAWDWRCDFLAIGRLARGRGGVPGTVIDTGKVLSALDVAADVCIPAWMCSGWALAAASLSMAGFLAALLLSVTTLLPSSVPVAWGLLQMGLSIGLSAGPLRGISRAVGRLHGEMEPYVSLVRHVGGADFRSGELLGLRDALACGDVGALESLGRLKGILASLDSRGNVLGLIVMNAFLLGDFFLVRRFASWRRACMAGAPGWLEAISSVDALVSMATFRFNEPKARDPEVVDAPGVAFEAAGLRHPFLGEGAVGNDFTVMDGHHYIITGANMAGKSTFLRSVGINCVLAMNGMPVFAESLRLSVFGLFTSMRTADDLTRGISYFNAELLRLRALMEGCGDGGRTLVILDEILKGTNSLDKLNGSRLFLGEMCRRRVTGIVATHDLELSRMEEEMPDRFHNWCFEIGLGRDVTYTYRITPGVARNQNATFLLGRMLGLAGGDGCLPDSAPERVPSGRGDAP